MRTTVDIDAQLLERLWAEADARGISFAQALNFVLRQGLDGPAEQPERYESPTMNPTTPLESRRRRRAALRQSLAAPHPESLDLAAKGRIDWSLPDEGESPLVDPDAGVAIRWVEGEGWRVADS